MNPFHYKRFFIEIKGYKYYILFLSGYTVTVHLLPLRGVFTLLLRN